MSGKMPKSHQETHKLFKHLQKEIAVELEKRKFLVMKLETFVTLKQELDALSTKQEAPSNLKTALMKKTLIEAQANVTQQLDVLKREITYTEQLIAEFDKRVSSYENSMKKLVDEFKGWKAF